MSALLDELAEKYLNKELDNDEIRWCIFSYFEACQADDDGSEPSETQEYVDFCERALKTISAKDEALAAKDAEIARLKRIETIAADVNEWLIKNNLGGTAHQRELAAALQEAQ